MSEDARSWLLKDQLLLKTFFGNTDVQRLATDVSVIGQFSMENRYSLIRDVAYLLPSKLKGVLVQIIGKWWRIKEGRT